MKRVLIVSYSQTGQLDTVTRSIAGPLVESLGMTVEHARLAPQEPYPFPWPFLTFFNTFPETVHGRPRPIQPLRLAPGTSFDLIILAYQVWFLSPSQPMTAFLQSPDAARLLRGKP